MKRVLLDWDLQLPDFASAAVLLRTALLANLCMLVGAILKQDRAWTPTETFLSGAAIGEPALLLTMLVLAVSWGRASSKLRSFLALFTGAFAAGAVTLLHPDGGRAGAVLGSRANAAIMSVLLCLYFDWRYRRLSPAVAEAKLEALVSRMRPHFLFNSINGIVMLLNKSPAAAEDALLDLADVFRALLKEGTGYSKVAAEIDLTQKYLRIEKMRFDQRMQVRVECDPACRDALLPTMLLQPLVENAVIHGIETIGSGAIDIQVSSKDGRLLLVVENPFSSSASGRKLRKSNGIATENIRQRLSLLYDVDAKFTSEEASPGLWRASLNIPFRLKAPTVNKPA